MSRDDASVASELNAFETWAYLSAQLYRRGVAERARAVHAVGFENRWHEIDEVCFERLAADIDAGRVDLLDRYLTIVAEVRAQQTTPELPSPQERRFRGVVAPGYTDIAPASSVPPPASATPPFAHQLDEDSITGPIAVPEDDDDANDAADTQLRATELREAMLAAEKASTWSVERFCWAVAAEQQAPERAEAFWQAEAITTPPGRSAVRRLWEKRLARDEVLRERYDDLIEDFGARFRRGEEGAPPS